MLKRYQFWEKLAAFYEEEGVLATIEPSSRDNGVVRVTGSSNKRMADAPLGIPALAMVTEQYNRLIRMLDNEVEPELEIDVAVHWYERWKSLQYARRHSGLRSRQTRSSSWVLTWTRGIPVPEPPTMAAVVRW